MSETRIEEDTQRTVVRRVESCEEVAIPESMGRVLPLQRKRQYVTV
jgi:hypothetical protein